MTTEKQNRSGRASNDLNISMGRKELTIRRRYETLSIANDFLIGLWFLVGSAFFLYTSLVEAGTWLFIVGSAQLMIRPSIRLAHKIHLNRVPAGHWDM